VGEFSAIKVGDFSVVIMRLLTVLYKLVFHSRAKLLVSSHGGDIFGLKPLARLKRFVLDRCDGVTVVSNAIRKEVVRLGCPRLRMEVLPMGVDMERFHPKHRDDALRREIAPNGPLALFVGRLSEKKGLRYLLDAMPHVIRRFPELTLLVVGEGEDREALEAHARSLGLTGDRVIFYGGVANDLLPRFYATVDVFVGPSVTASGGDAEGFGLVFVEALACSCPVIATDLPAMADIVSPGENGRIVEQRCAAAIAEALTGLLEDRGLLSQLRSRARSSVADRYDWEIVSARYAQILGD
jgi:glycosyltransferase involved in cell wall biosynthesis